MRIDIAKVHKHFGSVRANDGVSMTVQSGSIHGLLGENGAGKTTLMKILSGYQRADSGTISLEGAEVCFGSPAEAIAAGIGMLHQDPMDVPPMTVLDNFMLGASRSLFPQGARMQQKLTELGQRFGFRFDPQALVSSLTVGERQQLEIIRLLALGVRTIILDEPTTGISAPQKLALFATLRELASEGLSVIFVSHKLQDVDALCAEATVLRQGRVAGQMVAPFDQDALVQMMFGQCLSRFPHTTRPQDRVQLALHDGLIADHRLVVDDIDLDVRAGEVIGLAGLEGSGQQLLMQACAGLVPLTRGKLVVDGQDMTHGTYLQFLSRGVAYVPAARLEEGMVPGLTIREHVALAGPSDGLMIPWPEAERRSNEMIQTYNIVGRPETLVQELSGGNQQRTMLALLPDNLSLLMLEHPTRGLDMESTQWVWNRLRERSRQGTAIVFASTDLDELVENSDRIVVFSGGQMADPVDAATITCEELGYLIGGRRL